MTTSRDRAAKQAYDHDRYMRHSEAIKARVKAWRAANPDKARAYGHRWKKKHPSAVKSYGAKRYASRKEQQADYTRRKKYGIGNQEMQAMLQAQAGCCAICERDHEQFHIDHDHRTGRVRQILCRHCNTGLGFFQDDPVLLRCAATYVERWAI